jgi:hypothetical protein
VSALPHTNVGKLLFCTKVEDAESVNEDFTALPNILLLLPQALTVEDGPLTSLFRVS